MDTVGAKVDNIDPGDTAPPHPDANFDNTTDATINTTLNTTLSEDGSPNTSLESEYRDTTLPLRPSPFTLRSMCGQGRCPMGTGLLFRSRISPSPSKTQDGNFLETRSGNRYHIYPDGVRVRSRRRRRSDQSRLDATDASLTYLDASIDHHHHHDHHHHGHHHHDHHHHHHGHQHAEDHHEHQVRRDPRPRMKRRETELKDDGVEEVGRRSRTPRSKRKDTVVNTVENTTQSTLVARWVSGLGPDDGPTQDATSHSVLSTPGHANTLSTPGHANTLSTPGHSVLSTPGYANTLPGIAETPESGFVDQRATGVTASTPNPDQFVSARWFFDEAEGREPITSDYFSGSEGQSRRESVLQLLGLRKPHNKYIVYSSDEEFEEWRNQPKTDYTYSASLTYRDQVTPDRKIGSPNMSRRSLRGGNVGYLQSPEFSPREVGPTSRLDLRNRTVIRTMDALSDTSDTEENQAQVTTQRRLRSSRSRSHDVITTSNGTYSKTVTTTTYLHTGLDYDSDMDDGTESTVPVRATPLTARSGTPLGRAPTPLGRATTPLGWSNAASTQRGESVPKRGGYTLAKGAIPEEIEEEEETKNVVARLGSSVWEVLKRTVVVVTTTVVMFATMAVASTSRTDQSTNTREDDVKLGAEADATEKCVEGDEASEQRSVWSRVTTTTRSVVTSTTEYLDATRERARKNPLLLWIPVLLFFLILALIAYWWLLTSRGRADPDEASFLTLALTSVSDVTAWTVSSLAWASSEAWQSVVGGCAWLGAASRDGLSYAWASLSATFLWLGSLLQAGFAYAADLLFTVLGFLQYVILLVFNTLSSGTSYLFGFIFPISGDNNSTEDASEEGKAWGLMGLVSPVVEQASSVAGWASGLVTKDSLMDVYVSASEVTQASGTWLWNGWLWLVVSLGEGLTSAASFTQGLVLSLGSFVSYITFGFWDILVSAGVGLWDTIVYLAVGLWDILVYLAVGVWDILTYISVGAWDILAYLALGLWDILTYTAVGLWGFLSYFFLGLWNAISYLGLGLVATVTSAASTASTVAVDTSTVIVNSMSKPFFESTTKTDVVEKVTTPKMEPVVQVTNPSVLDIVERVLKSSELKTLIADVASENSKGQLSTDEVSVLVKSVVEGELSSIKAETLELRQNVDSKLVSSDETNNYISLLKEHHERLFKDLDELGSRLVRMEGVAEASQKDGEELRVRYEEQLAALKAQANTLSSQLDQLQTDHSVLSSEVKGCCKNTSLTLADVERHVTTLLGDILGLAPKDAASEGDATAGGMAAWLKSYFVAKDELDTRLDLLISSMQFKTSNENVEAGAPSATLVQQTVAQTSQMVMNVVLEQLRAEIVKQHTQMSEQTQQQVAEQVSLQVQTAAEVLGTQVADQMQHRLEASKQQLTEQVMSAVKESVDAAVPQAVADAVPDLVASAVPGVVQEVLPAIVDSAVEEGVAKSLPDILDASISDTVTKVVDKAVSEAVSEALPAAVETSLPEMVNKVVQETVPDAVSTKVSEGIAAAVPEMIASAVPDLVQTVVNQSVSSAVSAAVDVKLSKGEGQGSQVGGDGVVVVGGVTSSDNGEQARVSATVNVSNNQNGTPNLPYITSGSLSAGLNESAVIQIVKDALLKYDADKTGMVDHALETAGGNIVSTRCTESYHVHQAEISILGVPIYRYSTNNPRTIIQPGRMPGQCWAFKGSQGYVVIQLAGPVRPTGFSLEHIPKSLSPSGEIDSAPREFEVWGLNSEVDEGVALGTFEYSQHGEPLQFFPVTQDNSQYFNLIELKINSNHGNLQYTCIYRFRVHGLRYLG